MQLSRALLFLGLSASLLVGCVSEPAADDNTVFGHVSKPKRVKEKPLPKPRPAKEEAGGSGSWSQLR